MMKKIQITIEPAAGCSGTEIAGAVLMQSNVHCAIIISSTINTITLLILLILLLLIVGVYSVLV